jgi:hypothetical protein
MTRVSIAKPFFAVALAVMVGIFTASAKGPVQQGAGSNGAMSSAFGAFWQVGNGYSSTLVLRNNDHHNATGVQVTLFGSTGQQVGITQIQLAHDAVNRLDLSTVTGGQGGFGGLVLGFAGPATPQVAGKVVISDSQSGASVDLPVQGGYRYDTENALYAPWWTPDQATEGRVALFNASAQSLVVSPSISLKGAEQSAKKLNLAPYQTTIVTLYDLGVNEQQQGAVVLRYSGSPHALQPALLLENRSTGFWLASTFNAKHGTPVNQSAGWQVPDVRIASDKQNAQDATHPETYALLTNGSVNRVSPQVTAYYGLRGQPTKAAIPVTVLAPLETRLIDLSENVRNGLIPTSVSQLALSANYAGQPGDLAMEIFSVDQATNQVSKYAGTVLPPGVVDASYWNVGTNVCLLPKVENTGSTTASGQVAAYYSTSLGVGSYFLPALSVAGGKSRTLPLKHDLQSGIPDQIGETVPAGAGAGLLTLSAANSNGSVSSTSAIGAQCSTLEACTPPSNTQASALSAGLHLISTPSCSAPQAPVITSISPTGAPFSTDTSVTINGENFDDPGMTVAISGGIQAKNLSCSSSTQCTATFDTSGETTVGTQDMYLSSDYGHSNSEDFEVGDPTPSIDNVSPPIWPAGTTTPVTITGSGFGTKPLISLSDSSISYSITNATDNGLPHGASITANVTVPAPNPGEGVTVSVTSQGYSGNGFTRSTSGQSAQSPTFNVTTTPIPAPKPAIFFNGSDITTNPTTPQVVVGQQILLKGCVNASGNTCQNPPLAISSQAWGVPSGTVVAGYTNAAGNGPPDTTGGQTTQLLVFTNPTITYYWVKGGNPLTETYSYCMVNGQCSSTVTAKFNVQGFASGAPFTAVPTAGAVKIYNEAGSDFLECGNANPTVCITFTATAAPPAGGSANASFQWVQIINSTTSQYRTTPSTPNVLCLGSGVQCPALDNAYPYATLAGQPNTTNDSPGMELVVNGVTGFGEGGETFKAQMYMMWDPALMAYGQSGSCTPAYSRQNANGTVTSTASTCTGSIPIPVGYVIWGFGGDAINPSDQVNSTSWILSCGGPNPANPSVVNSSVFPLWTRSTSNHQ